MECLIVDDCGSDESIAIAEQMIAAYEGSIQFQILHHERNRGLSAARNTGTMQAKGTYLYYLDSDDEMTEDCIETLIGQMKAHPRLEMVQGNAIRLFSTNRSVVDVKQVSLPLAVTNEEVRRCFYQLKQMSVYAWNKLFRRDLIFHNNILFMEGVLFEDMLWSFNLLKVLKHVGFISEITYHHRVRPNSITTGTDKRTRILNYCTIYREILTHLTPGHEQEEFSFHARRFCSILLRFFRYDSGMEEVFMLCCDLSRQYGDGRLRFKLTVYRFLGSFKYGWVVIALWKRVKRPTKKHRDGFVPFSVDSAQFFIGHQ
jgi:glycosyltransferase involved in cell wall biosynthesis